MSATTAKDDLSDKTCMMTGATNGIGLVATRSLADMGVQMGLLCRDRPKGEGVIADIMVRTGNQRITLMIGDLSSLADVRQMARSFLDQGKPPHLLLNNVGVFNFKRATSMDGYEEMLADVQKPSADLAVDQPIGR